MSTETQEVKDTAEGTGTEQQKPFYAEFGEFQDEGAFAEHFKSVIAEKQQLALEAEQLRSKTYEPKFGFLKDVESVIEQGLSAGEDEESAYKRAVEYVGAIARPWKKEAQSDPVAVLLERDKRKYPSEDAAGLKKDILAEYGLNRQKPDESDTEAMDEYNEAVERGMRKARQAALEVAEQFEKEKAGLKVHPLVAQKQNENKASEQIRKEAGPKYTAALQEVASSLTLEIEGATIPVKVTDATGKFMPQYEFLAQYDPSYFIDAKGGIDTEKVRASIKNAFVISNFGDIAKQLVNHGKSLSMETTTSERRNPGEKPNKAAPSGKAELSETERAYRDSKPT